MSTHFIGDWTTHTIKRRITSTSLSLSHTRTHTDTKPTTFVSVHSLSPLWTPARTWPHHFSLSLSLCAKTNETKLPNIEEEEADRARQEQNTESQKNNLKTPLHLSTMQASISIQDLPFPLGEFINSNTSFCFLLLL